MRASNVGTGSSIRRHRTDAVTEDRFRSYLPKEVVAWNLFEAAQPSTFESLYQVYQMHGQNTLYMLKGAAALDCQEVMKNHGLRGVHPQSFEALYGNSLHPNG